MGNYTAEEQQPDKDLGRSLKPGWRNIAREVRLALALTLTLTQP